MACPQLYDGHVVAVKDVCRHQVHYNDLMSHTR